jgi:hypothetical protein
MGKRPKLSNPESILAGIAAGDANDLGDILRGHPSFVALEDPRYYCVPHGGWDYNTKDMAEWLLKRSQTVDASKALNELASTIFALTSEVDHTALAANTYLVDSHELAPSIWLRPAGEDPHLNTLADNPMRASVYQRNLVVVLRLEAQVYRFRRDEPQDRELVPQYFESCRRLVDEVFCVLTLATQKPVHRSAVWDNRPASAFWRRNGIGVHSFTVPRDDTIGLELTSGDVGRAREPPVEASAHRRLGLGKEAPIATPKARHVRCTSPRTRLYEVLR